MAMKPEPMEFEGESCSMLNQAQVYPMQLIQNDTLIHNDSIQMDPHSFSQSQTEGISNRNTVTSPSTFPPNSHLDQNYAMDDEPGKMLSQQTRQRSTVSEILLGGKGQQLGSRGKNYQNCHLQPYTIARGELELNSKFLPKKYKCGMCVYKTSYKSDLNRHMRRHANNKDVPACKDCNLTFSSQSSLLVHNKKCPFRGRMVAGNLIQLRCAICPYSTSYKSDLNRHMKCHYTYEFACDVCNKPFKVLGMVDHHRQSAHDIHTSVFGIGNIDSSPAINPYRQWTVEDTSIKNTLYLPEAENSGTSIEESPKSAVLQMRRKSNILSYHKAGLENNHSDVCTLVDVGLDNRESILEPPADLPITEGIQSVSENISSATRNYPNDKYALLNTYSSETEKGNVEDGDNRCGTPDSASKTQLQKQSRVRELLSLNSSKQPTVTLSIKQFCCEKCSGIFASIKELLHHKKSCLQKGASRLYRCTMCAFQTCNNLTFKRHKRKHSSAAYSCECCNQPFLIERNLIKHKPFCRRADNILNPNDASKLIRSNRNRARSSEAVLERNQQIINTDAMHGAEKSEKRLPPPRTEVDTIGGKSVTRTSKPGDVLTRPPEWGRFARLISDFDEFSKKPYACALCFFRTANISNLSKHVENHLTGCNLDPIPESARFSVIHKSYQVHQQSAFRTLLTERNVHKNLCQQSVKNTSLACIKQEQLRKPNAIISTKVKYQANPPSFQSRSFRSGGDRWLGMPKQARAFACRVCGKQFSVKTLMVRHLKKIHKDDMETEEGGMKRNSI